MTDLPNNKALQKELLNVLTKECGRVGSAISELDQSSQRIFPIAAAVLSLVGSYGIKEEISEVVMALPYLLMTVSFYSVHTYTEVVTLGGYRRHLEEQINLQLGTALLNWESTLAPRRHWSIAQLFLYVLYGGFLLGACVSGTWQALTAYGCGIAIIEGATLAVLAVGLVWALKRMSASFNEAYGETKTSGLRSGA